MLSKIRRNKKKEHIDLIKEIKESIEKYKEEKPVNSTRIWGLEELLTLIRILNDGYPSSSKRMSWENISQAILFLYITLNSNIQDKDYEKLDSAFIDKYYFKEFLNFIFERESWEKWDYYELETIVARLILYHIPNKIFEKISLPLDLIIKINLCLMSEWAFQKVFTVKTKLVKIFKLSESDFDIHFFVNTKKWFANEFFIETISNKEKKILTYERLGEVMKDNIKFWDLITNRENIKIAPNKKYTEEMFELTSQKKLEGLKDYVAYRQTLDSFGFDSMKDESYGKRYRSYLKKKK